MSSSKIFNQSVAGIDDAQVARSDDEKALVASADTQSMARKGLSVLILGLGGFLLWASLAPLDEGVPSVGAVAIDTKRKVVQHLSGGIVQEVMVREGDEVSANQVLIRLDASLSKADFESIRQRYLGLSAVQSRLQAEQKGSGVIEFQKDVLAALSDPMISDQVKNQRMLFESRRQALKAEIKGMQDALDGLKAQRKGSQEVLAERQKQLVIIKEELSNIRDLVKEGYAPRNRQMEIERLQADTQASIADLTGSISRSASSIAELNQKLLSRQFEYRKEVESQLADVSREVQADAEKFAAMKLNLERVEIRAPAKGRVMGLTVQTVGAVVQPGQKLMDIVPEKQDLLLEAHIAPHLIDKIHEGLFADVRFSTFAHSPQLVVEGKVLSVSGDLVVDPQNPAMSHYLARLELTPAGIKTLGSRQLQPGMPAEIVIKTGERSMLTYLLHPLLKRLAGSMKEE
jgi:protease secretion system membrane fusion protein